MRRTLIITLLSLFIALAISIASLLALNATVETARDIHNRALLAAEQEDPELAKDLMVELAAYWKGRSDLLEILTSHDALHEVESGILEAQICLECEDHDDFLRTMSTVGQGLDHISSVELLSLSNLY